MSPKSSPRANASIRFIASATARRTSPVRSVHDAIFQSTYTTTRPHPCAPWPPCGAATGPGGTTARGTAVGGGTTACGAPPTGGGDTGTIDFGGATGGGVVPTGVVDA